MGALHKSARAGGSFGVQKRLRSSTQAGTGGAGQPGPCGVGPCALPPCRLQAWRCDVPLLVPRGSLPHYRAEERLMEASTAAQWGSPTPTRSAWTLPSSGAGHSVWYLECGGGFSPFSVGWSVGVGVIPFTVGWSVGVGVAPSQWAGVWGWRWPLHCGLECGGGLLETARGFHRLGLDGQLGA